MSFLHHVLNKKCVKASLCHDAVIRRRHYKLTLTVPVIMSSEFTIKKEPLKLVHIKQACINECLIVVLN